MKILKNCLFGFAGLLLVVVLGAVIFFSTFDLNRYLEPITAQASAALGRKVTIEHAGLDLNIFKGIGLQLNNVQIADDVLFGAKEFFKLGEMTASLDTMAFLTKREIIVTSIVLSKITVHIIRDDKGVINAQLIGVRSLEAAVPGKTISDPQASAPLVLPLFLVKSISINDSTLIFDDTNKAMPLHLVAEQIKLRIDDLSMSGNNNIHMKANVNALSFQIADVTVLVRSIVPELTLDLSTLKLNGQLNIDLQGGEIQNLDLTSMILSKLTPIAVVGPMLSEMLQGSMGDLKLQNKTIIHSFTLNAPIKEGIMDIQTMHADATPIVVDAKGSVDLTRLNVDVGVNVKVSAELTQKLIKSASPLKGLVNDAQELLIPGKVSGIVPKLGYSPDLVFISKKIGSSEAADALGKQLDKVIEKNPEVGNLLNSVLGGGQKNDASNSDPESSKKMIKGLFNKILK